MSMQTAFHGDHDPRLEFDQADRLRRALRVSEVSVNDMADYLGVGRNTVSTWINGRIQPSTQTLRLFALRTGFPYEWLAQGEEWCTPRDLNPEPTDYESDAPLAAVVVGPWASSVAEFGGAA